MRATIYVHFPTRDALIDAVTQRAITEATAAVVAAEPERGDAADALLRVVVSAWRTLERYRRPASQQTRITLFCSANKGRPPRNGQPSGPARTLTS